MKYVKRFAGSFLLFQLGVVLVSLPQSREQSPLDIIGSVNGFLLILAGLILGLYKSEILED